MQLNVEWGGAHLLKDGTDQNLIYAVDLTRIPETPGVYVLGRRWGTSFEALYVGKAGNLRARLKTQMNNLKLMQHLRNSRNGQRVALIGQFHSKPGQQRAKCLALIERGFIRHYLSEGHDLVNIQGTRLRSHEIVSEGRHPKSFIPSPMYVE